MSYMDVVRLAKEQKEQEKRFEKIRKESKKYDNSMWNCLGQRVYQDTFNFD